MNIETVSNNGFHIAILHDDLTISTLSSLTPALSSLMQDNPKDDIVLDLSDVPTIDGSVIRLLQNIRKKLETTERKLYLLNVTEALKNQLDTFTGENKLPMIDSLTELHKNVNNDNYQYYLPFTYPEGDFLRFHCSCGVCGSKDVFGYHLKQTDYRWTWPENDYFPMCTSASGEPFDFFASLPIVCAECLTTSVDITNFNLYDADNQLKRHGNFDDQTKLLLSKSAKKRKKILDKNTTAIGDTFFKCPRNGKTAFYVYQLAESCARIAVVNHPGTTMFTIGYLSYLSLLFSDKASKERLIDNCRTWLTQTLSDQNLYNHVELSQSFYIVFVASLSMGKYKDLNRIMENYNTFIEQIGSISDEANDINSPHFWFTRADEIWKDEIARKSSAITL
jgi:anti-anti-sigma regulatory factor